MSPPIRDGSGNSIGSIRLGDGSEIAEVRTGAGDVLFSASAIPSSAVARYTVKQLSLNDGDAVNAWIDQSGKGQDLDAGTGGTYKTGQLGGSNQNDAVRCDARGNNEILQTSSFSSESQPNTVFLAGRIENTTGVINTAVNGTASTSSDQHDVHIDDASDNIGLQREIQGGNALSKDIIVTGVFDTSNSLLRVNGSQVASGSIPSETLQGLTLGEGGSGPTNLLTGELLILNKRATSTQITEQENRLSDEFDIPV